MPLEVERPLTSMGLHRKGLFHCLETEPSSDKS